MLFIAIRAPLTYQRLYHDYATSRSQAEIQQELREKCRSAPSIEEIWTCISEGQIGASQETRRAEEDLYAQKQMADWALGILLATVVVGAATIIVTSIDIYYVRGTFEEQKTATKGLIEANRIATKQFKAGVKPWINVTMAGPFLDLSTGKTLQQFADGERERPVLVFADIAVQCMSDVPATIEESYVGLLHGA